MLFILQGAQFILIFSFPNQPKLIQEWQSIKQCQLGIFFEIKSIPDLKLKSKRSTHP